MTLTPVRSDLPALDHRFRPEIEGLRAVAALLVAIYHIYLGRVSGGVDVFFVVAGFFITTTLYSQVLRNGAISFGRFFSRLTTRLLPHALTVLAVVFVASTVFLPAGRRTAAWQEITASAFYGENWQLIAKATDYLDQGAAASPVQHFWAMSVQGQFYVLWAILFGAVFWAVRRRPAAFHSVLTAALASVVIAGLCFSVYLTAVNQPVAYFHTGTRVWEFALGGLVALLVRRPIPGRLGAACVWAGLVVIVGSGLVLRVSTSFPGYAALVPCLGAVLVMAGSGGYGRLGADRLLSNRLLVRLGGLSYGIYLWHWPMLIFALAWLGTDRVPVLLGAAIILGAIALSAATARFIERPLWKLLDERDFAPGARILAAIAAVAVLASGIQIWGLGVKTQPAEASSAAIGSLSFVDSGGASRMDEPLVPELVSVAGDNPPMYGDGCHQNVTSAEVIECVYGAEDAERTVVVLGGSHSAHWLPALQAIAEDEPFRIVSMTKSGCAWSLRGSGNGHGDWSCGDWNRSATERVAEMAPEIVLTTSTRGVGSDEYVPDGYIGQWEKLEQMAPETTVLALRDNPRMKKTYLDCLSGATDYLSECGRPRQEVRPGGLDEIDAPGVPATVEMADLTNYFCTDTYCPSVAGNVVIYRDVSHLTESYSRTLAEPLRAKLAAAGF